MELACDGSVLDEAIGHAERQRLVAGRVLGKPGKHALAKAAGEDVFLHRHKKRRFEGSAQQFLVHGLDEARVHHAGAHAVVHELYAGVHRRLHHAAHGEEDHVFALAQQLPFADAQRFVRFQARAELLAVPGIADSHGASYSAERRMRRFKSRTSRGAATTMLGSMEK